MKKLLLSSLIPTIAMFQPHAYGDNRLELEEIIVTAQKREQRLQDTPVAISTLTDFQLTQQGIGSLGDMISSTITSLSVQPYANTPSTLVVAIRGNGPGDIAQSTRESSVGIYLDEIYLGRAQGLDLELPDLERIEILRGPQGTLFGRNASAGAISLVSKRPSGEFKLNQTVTLGNYDLFSSVTHIDLPKVLGLSSKIDLLYSERDGWVDNTDSSEADYNEFQKEGARLTANWSAIESLDVNYFYTFGNTKMTQNYFQLYEDLIGSFGTERKRQKRTRAPVTTLDPTKTLQTHHTVSFDWAISDTLTFKSLSSVREMHDRTRNNYAGAIYFNGLIEAVDIEQEQYTQEFRLTGSYNRLDWVAGLYYYKEDVDEEFQQLFSLDIFGLINPDPLSPIDPVTNFDVLATSDFLTPLEVNSEIESRALYSQATWTPPILNDNLEITLGVRVSDDDKSGVRSQGGFVEYDVDENRTDHTFIVNYHWADDISTYAKWSTGFRSGGVNVRSPNLVPFDTEESETYEVGFKAEGWQRRVRLNTAVFQTNYDGLFLDVFQPDNLAIADTINAINQVEVDGAEIELSVIPVAGLTVALNYTYLDGEMPKQANSLGNGVLERFYLTQTPQHSGSMTIDYVFPTTSIGTLSAHADIISTDAYFHYPSGGEGHPDGYSLINGRVQLADIPAGRGTLTVALWGKNLTDEEYIVTSFGIPQASVIQAFGEPRTAGVDVSLQF